MANTDVAVIGTVAGNANLAVVSNLFRDIDFSGLNSIIDNIGGASNELTIEEKESAVKIVGEWEKNVLYRLRDYEHNLHSLVALLNNNNYANWENQSILSATQINTIVANTQLEELYTPYVQALAELEEYQEDNEPEKPYVDNTLSPLEVIQIESAYKVELANYKIEVAKLNRKTVLAFNTFIRAFRKHEIVKSMVESTNEQIKTIGGFIVDCSDKTQLAKLNITISSATVREALRGLIDFSKTI